MRLKRPDKGTGRNPAQPPAKECGSNEDPTSASYSMAGPYAVLSGTPPPSPYL